MNKKEILNELIFDEEEEFKTLVNKAKRIINIRKSNGEIIIINKDKLNTKETIACFITGKYFSKEMGFIEDSKVSIEEISDSVDIDKSIVRARASDLKAEKIINSPERGFYEIELLNLNDYLQKIIDRLNL